MYVCMYVKRETKRERDFVSAYVFYVYTRDFVYTYIFTWRFRVC